MSNEISNQIVIYYIIGTLFIFFMVISIIIYVIMHINKVNDFRLKMQQIAQESELKERSRLAFEIHDGIGAKLSGIKMKMEFIYAENKNENLAILLSSSLLDISETIDEIRLISHNLEMNIQNESDLCHAIENYLESLNLKSQCKYQYYSNIEKDTIPKYIIMPIYRILSELIHNIHKHANATIATIQLTIYDSKFQIIVEDNGVGFNHKVKVIHGMGLNNIQKRIESFNGEFHLDSSNTGSTIILEIPLNI